MTEKADVVVIGSGVAGAMSAWRLASRGLRVLMLEAGPRVDRNEARARFVTANQNDFGAGFPNTAHAPRPDWSGGDDAYLRQSGEDRVRLEYLRVVGGTTWHWTGASDRLLPIDLRSRTAYAIGTDWPIGYDDLEPYYVRAEREMGVAGLDEVDHGSPRSAGYPLPRVPASYADKIIAERLRDLGVVVTPRPAARNTVAFDGRARCEGYGTCTPLCPTGAQYAAIVHVAKAVAAGVRLLDNARVDRLEADAAGRVVRAVFRRPGGTEQDATGKAFVLAANALESARLLLASAGERFPRGLANGSDQVGRNYMGRPGIFVCLETGVPLYSNRGPVFSSIIENWRDGDFRRNEPSILISLSNRIVGIDFATEFLDAGMLPPKLDQAIRERAIRLCTFETSIEELPRPENRVTIDWHDRDSAGQPRLCLHHSYSEYEKRGFARHRDIFNIFAKKLEARKMVQTRVFDHHHLLGTLRMGDDARMSVVDAECRSHDHANLFVAGSAVFPTGGTGHPTLTIAALALRMAEAIVRQIA